MLKSKSKEKGLSLPENPSKPETDLGKYSTLLYGREKIGKTSFAAQFPDAFFLMCEPGGKALSIYKRNVMNWAQLRGYVDLLEQNKGQFKTVVVDTVDMAAQMCVKYVCEKLAISHPSDEEWGKGWQAVTDEMSSVMSRLLKLGRGVIFISHSKEKELKKRNGTSSHRVIPTMPSQARTVLEPMVDIWAYYCYTDEGKRTLHICGDEHIAAGHRLVDRFKNIKEIPMGSSPLKAYENFLAAFENRLASQNGGMKVKVRE